MARRRIATRPTFRMDPAARFTWARECRVRTRSITACARAFGSPRTITSRARCFAARPYSPSRISGGRGVATLPSRSTCCATIPTPALQNRAWMLWSTRLPMRLGKTRCRKCRLACKSALSARYSTSWATACTTPQASATRRARPPCTFVDVLRSERQRAQRRGRPRADGVGSAAVNFEALTCPARTRPRHARASVGVGQTRTRRPAAKPTAPRACSRSSPEGILVHARTCQ
jgi:hypothetical protein